MEHELNIDLIAAKIQELPLGTTVQLVRDIAKKSKKKTLQSGTQSFAEFCKTIAKALTKETTKELVKTYDLV